MIKTAILDVTRIEPRLKHPTIFDHFDALDQGESFVIHNDHDPRPLYYQLLGERGNFFTWEYLESGPDYWKVKIAKPLSENAIETIGEIAAKDTRKAEIFRKMGIDFCCGGKQTIKEAASAAGLGEQEVLDALEHADQVESKTVLEFDKWDLGFLADYIYNVHHRYIRENGPIIEQLVDKVAMRHGQEHQELLQLAVGMHGFMADLYDHLRKEEEALFPLLKQLEKGEKDGMNRVSIPVRAMEQEHEAAGGELRAFRALTKNYRLPANACNSYTYLYEKIKEFENDLFQHIHLENNILFPKAVKLEQEVLG